MPLRRLSQAAQEAVGLLARRWSSTSASCSSCTALRRQLASAVPVHLAMPGVGLQQVLGLKVLLLKGRIEGHHKLSSVQSHIELTLTRPSMGMLERAACASFILQPSLCFLKRCQRLCN